MRQAAYRRIRVGEKEEIIFRRHLLGSLLPKDVRVETVFNSTWSELCPLKNNEILDFLWSPNATLGSMLYHSLISVLEQKCILLKSGLLLLIWLGE